MNATVRVNFRQDVWLLNLDFYLKTATVKGDMPQDGAFLIARFINQLGREIHAVPSLDELSRKLYIFYRNFISHKEDLASEIKNNLGLEVEMEEEEGKEGAEYDDDGTTLALSIAMPYTRSKWAVVSLFNW